VLHVHAEQIHHYKKPCKHKRSEQTSIMQPGCKAQHKGLQSGSHAPLRPRQPKSRHKWLCKKPSQLVTFQLLLIDQ
jgi:hypothetical protein